MRGVNYLDFVLPELDRDATKAKVEDHFGKYRLFKYLTYERREATVTASTEERFHGPTNVTNDQTSSIAIHNVDEQERRKSFCEWTERAVRRLPPMERFLIEERYMSNDAEYITDFNIYFHKFKPPISDKKYDRIRWKAFYKLALDLNIAVVKE